jgi:hypothetical protein
MSPELKSWIREQLDIAVQTLNNQQVYDDPFIESKPAWMLPMQILLGKARAQSDPRSYRWFICGDVPFDHIDSTAAATPREALRHLAMKWQYDAEGLDKAGAEPLIAHAESLYDLTEDDRLWPA